MTTKGFTDELKALSAHSVIGSAQNELLDAMLQRINQHVDMPLRLYATHPTADSKINIGPNQVELGDGANQSTGPADGVINVFPVSSIDAQVVAGDISGGTIKTEGGTFAFPAGTVGQFRRMALVYQSADNQVDTVFSDEAASVGALTNPALLFDALDSDSLVGWIDLECTDVTGKYKTAASATAIIENKVGADVRVNRFGSGSGGGAGGTTAFFVQSIGSNVAKIKKDLVRFAGRELVLYDGADYNVDLSVNLKTEVNSAGITAPANSTRYYLYLDANYLPIASIVFGDADRVAYAVEKGTSSPFVVKLETPEEIGGSRFMPLCALKTDGSGDYIEKDNMAVRSYDAPAIISPLIHTVGQQVVGAVGDSGQIQAAHDLEDDSFPFAVASKAYFWNLGDINDDSGNGKTLTNNGTIAFSDADQWANAASAAELNGSSKYLSCALDPGDQHMAFGGWFKATDWKPGAEECLLSLGTSATDWALELLIGSYGVKVRGSVDGTAESTVLTDDPNFVNGSWHHLGCVYDATDDKLKLYLDSVFINDAPLSALTSLTADLFTIGAKYAAAQDWFAGTARDVFVVQSELLSGQDMRKFYCSRIDLPGVSQIPADTQNWLGFTERADGEVADDLLTGWLIDKRQNKVYIDLGLSATDQATLRLYDAGVSAQAVGAKPFAKHYTANPSATVAHGLPDMPTMIFLLHDSANDGKYVPLDASSFVKADGTNFYFDFPVGYVTSDNDLWVVAGVALAPVVIDPTKEWIVASSAITGVSGRMYAYDNSGSANTFTLPASPSAGDWVKLADAKKEFDTNNLTVDRNGEKIEGVADNDVIDTEGTVVEYVYIDSSYGWRRIV